MISVIFRTFLMYVIVIFTMRIMGKKNLGEFQPSDLASTIMISNLTSIEVDEAAALAEATKKVAEVIANDGLIFTFGCGHSHLPGLDAFYRAGGLANVSPMLDTDLMLHNGAAKSRQLPIFSYWNAASNAAFSVSTSGEISSARYRPFTNTCAFSTITY